jgi:hypothetical protein
MRTFIDYLFESVETKKYAFKVKIAGDLPENCEDVMENALKKYDVNKFSKSKTTPIQAKVHDFPTLENLQVNIFDIELNYPTTSQVLINYLSEHTGITTERIRVRSPLEEAEAELNVAHMQEDSDGKALLTQDYQKENHQDLVGEKKVASLLKELTKDRKDKGPKQYKGVNDSILAKKQPKEKPSESVKAGPARSVLAAQKGNPDPRKGK